MEEEETYDSPESNIRLQSIPQEMFSRVTYFLTPLERQQMINSLPYPEEKFSPAEIFSAWIWSNIFHPDSWPDQIYKHLEGGDLALISPDIENLSKHPNADACLLLLRLDWTGDSYYLEPGLSESLKNPELYNAKKREVRLAGTCVKVQFGHDSKDDGSIMLHVEDPSVFFRQSGGKLWTNILYYSDDTIHTISEACIRGVDGISRKKKRHIRERCIFDVEYRDEIVRSQGLLASERPTPVVGVYGGPGTGGMIQRWRLPREGDNPQHFTTNNGF